MHCVVNDQGKGHEKMRKNGNIFWREGAILKALPKSCIIESMLSKNRQNEKFQIEWRANSQLRCRDGQKSTCVLNCLSAQYEQMQK